MTCFGQCFTKKITCYVHSFNKDKYLCSLLSQRKLLVMFTVTLKKKNVCYVPCYYKKKTCYGHCCYKEDILLCSLLLQRKLLDMIAVVIKINCYGHCCYKEIYFCSLLLQSKMNASTFTLVTKKITLFTAITKKIIYVHCYYNENNLLCSLLLQNKTTCYFHCCYKDYLLCLLL